MAEELVWFHAQRVGTGARQDLGAECIGLIVLQERALADVVRLDSDATERLFEVAGAEPRGLHPSLQSVPHTKSGAELGRER
jgi:hypothetical protein